MQTLRGVATQPAKLIGACDMMNTNVEQLIETYAEILDRDPLSQMEDTQSILKRFVQALAVELDREVVKYD
jgi:hypothetical protein